MPPDGTVWSPYHYDVARGGCSKRASTFAFCRSEIPPDGGFRTTWAFKAGVSAPTGRMTLGRLRVRLKPNPPKSWYPGTTLSAQASDGPSQGGAYPRVWAQGHFFLDKKGRRAYLGERKGIIQFGVVFCWLLELIPRGVYPPRLRHRGILSLHHHFLDRKVWA